MIALFLACVAWTALLLQRALPGIPLRAWVLTGAWLALQGLLGATGFYATWLVVEGVYTPGPPRLPYLIAPPVFLVCWLLFRRQAFIDGANLKMLTRLHAVRLGVETVLYMLYVAGQVPKIMTFEGRNYDVLAGASAVAVGIFAFRGGKINRALLGWWNLISLGLLLNIVVTAVLSVPTPLQKFGFEQPNIALAQWPYVWLPGFIVPAVFASHAFVLSRWWRGTL